jgi:hypothetical protein
MNPDVNISMISSSLHQHILDCTLNAAASSLLAPWQQRLHMNRFIIQDDLQEKRAYVLSSSTSEQSNATCPPLHLLHVAGSHNS